MLYLSENFLNQKDDHMNPMSPIMDMESTLIDEVTCIGFSAWC